MKLGSIRVRLVRNEYEYNKFASADYVQKKPWNGMSAKAPLLVFDFNKVEDFGDDDLTKTSLELFPAANWTDITPASNGEYSVDGSDNKKLNIDLTKLKGQLVVEAKKDCKFTSAPLTLAAMATTKTKNVYRDEYVIPDVSDKKSVLAFVDGIDIGGVGAMLKQVVYELCAQELPEGGVPEAPKDSKAYVRKNGAWVQETVGLSDAPKDGKEYVRKNQAWAEATKYLADAPSDANAYGRKGGNWVKVTEAPA